MQTDASIDSAGQPRNWRALLSPAAVVCIAATLARVLLNRDFAFQAIADASLDDQLSVLLGSAVARGFWLGDYSCTTLAKGPGYPIFIGISSYLQLPLHIAQEALYLAACAALALAMRPAVHRRGWTVGLYVVLLFNPMMWEASDMLRVLRQLISIPFMMLFVAAVAGCLFTDRRGVRFAWIAVGGVSAAMTWMTREESIWIVPLIAILAAAPLLLRGEHAASNGFYRRAAAMAAVALGLIGFVALLNRVNYGVYTLVELRDPAFKDAVGALMRVNPSERLPKVAVSRKSREMVYAVSPAFRELRPWLEGRVGENAVRASLSAGANPGTEGEILAGWFHWTLRDAVQFAGHYDSPLEARAYYRRLADEIDAACARGDLPCGPPLSGLIPPIDRAALRRAAAELRDIGRSFVVLPGVYDRMQRSVGTPTNLELFADVTRSPLAPTDHDPVTRRSALRGAMASIYRGIALLLIVASPALAFVAIRQQLRARRITRGSLVALGSGSAVAACAALLALMGATSCPGNLPGYLALAYPFFLLALWGLLHEGLRRDPGSIQTG